MTESPTPNDQPRRTGGLQTKALAGLVAIMLAAAIVALVFVVNGGGSTDKQAGGQRDVAHTRTSSASSGAATTTAPRTSTAPSTSAAPTSTSTSTSVVPSSSAPTTSATVTSSSHSADTKKVVYTVKKGDTLSDIGRWYSDHGYLKLYDWNKSVIGQDPNLIFPGQKIIVVDGHVGVARHSH